MATKRKPNKRTQANEWPKVTTCLTFNDRAEEAVRFYVSAFKDSEILSMVRSEADGPIPKGKLLNATFRLHGTVYTAFDGGPSFAFSQGTSIMVECGTQSEIDRLWETLSKGGEKGPCGWLTDQFGLAWQIIPATLGKMLRDGEARDRDARASLPRTVKSLPRVGTDLGRLRSTSSSPHDPRRGDARRFSSS